MDDRQAFRSTVSRCLTGCIGAWVFAVAPVLAQSGAQPSEPPPLELSEQIGAMTVPTVPQAQYLGDAGEQSAPSMSDSAPIPSYVYSPDYYTRDFGGLRPAADYAPPGYYPTHQQEGPAVPRFLPLDLPPRLTPEEREKFLTHGLVPGSILAPDTNTSILFQGFIRLAGLLDFDPIGVSDAFVTNSIPVPAVGEASLPGQNLNFSARISRFSLETWTPTSVLDWNVHTRIEGDFFNGLDQAAGGGGNPFRLRHAYIDFGPFRFGQQNSTFMDASSWPNLVDFQGPNSWVNQRQPSIRVTLPLAQRTFWAASIERPFSDIAVNDRGEAVQDVPDFGTHLRYQGDLGHLQVAGLVRTIGYRPTDEDVTRRAGGGVSGSFVYHPWAFLLGTDPVSDPNASGLTRSRTILQGAWGSGIGRYLNDLPNQRLDGQVDPLTGSFDLVRAGGWNASYEHWYNRALLSNFTYGTVAISGDADQPAETYNGSQYAAASLWWVPVARAAIAVEYMWGERENLDGQRGTARRLHTLFQYNF